MLRNEYELVHCTIELNADGDSIGEECGGRFAACTHVHETGCVVPETVKRGKLEEERYAN